MQVHRFPVVPCLFYASVALNASFRNGASSSSLFLATAFPILLSVALGFPFVLQAYWRHICSSFKIDVAGDSLWLFYFCLLLPHRFNWKYDCSIPSPPTNMWRGINKKREASLNMNLIVPNKYRLFFFCNLTWSSEFSIRETVNTVKRKF